MTFLLGLSSLVAMVASLLLFAIAKGAVHEATAAVFLLMAAVLGVGAVLNGSLNRLADRLDPEGRTVASDLTGDPERDKQLRVLFYAVIVIVAVGWLVISFQ